MISLMFTVLLISQGPTCDDVLSSADEALTACDKVVKDSEVLIQAQKDALLQSRAREKELMEERDSILRNPWFWGVVGAGIGAGSIILIRKY